MSEYSIFSKGQKQEYLCPVCGAELKNEYKKQDGWHCVCGELIPFGMEINPYKGLSNQHKQDSGWR